MNALQDMIAKIVAGLPDWMRRDLLSDDRVARLAAEDAIAAMIANKLQIQAGEDAGGDKAHPARSR